MSANAKLHEVKVPELEERGGKPKRKFRSAGGGPIQTAIYQSSQLLEVIYQRAGQVVQPTGQRGTYTYYCSENDYLDIHRDIYTCDMTLITCIQSDISDTDAHGQLYLYADRTHESLYSIYNNRSWGYKTVNLKPGESILIAGGVVPHGVNPLKASQNRIISALCFRQNH